MTDHDPAPSNISQKLATNWPYIATGLGLGVLWWVVLLVPEASRQFLIAGSELNMLWGFARVVALVVVASVAFRSMPRSASWKTCLSALACLWLGSGAFALTLEWSSWSHLLESCLTCLISAPLFFLAFAWYAVFPMTILTAVVLNNLDLQLKT